MTSKPLLGTRDAVITPGSFRYSGRTNGATITSGSAVDLKTPNPSPGLVQHHITLLRLHALLGKVERANRQRCLCGRLRYNEYSPPLIQCRNALCSISWFHKKCVSFPDSDDESSDNEGRDDEGSNDEGSDVEESWLCDKCKKTPKDKRAYIESRPTESNVFAKASHERLHLARAIENVWRKHDWPS